jgi:organic radical activating enzyme
LNGEKGKDMKILIPQNYYIEREQIPERTLQIFITSICNKKCRGCFYASHMTGKNVTLVEYKNWISFSAAADGVKKVVLMGGEPTLHPKINEIIDYNLFLQLKTTMYTNGTALQRLKRYSPQADLTIRVGVLGISGMEKSLDEVEAHGHKIEVCLMVRQDNRDKLADVASEVEKRFGADTPFMVSSIKDIERTGSFFINTEETLSEEEYAETVNTFLRGYKGHLEVIDICKRGAFEGEVDQQVCRFSNILTDGTRITCPLDIALGIRYPKNGFENRSCNKGGSCLLQKFRFRRENV